MKPMTINQLLDVFDQMKQSQMTVRLAEARQFLKDQKGQNPKGGLIVVENTEEVMALIEEAKENESN